MAIGPVLTVNSVGLPGCWFVVLIISAVCMEQQV